MSKIQISGIHAGTYKDNTKLHQTIWGGGDPQATGIYLSTAPNERRKLHRQMQLSLDSWILFLGAQNPKLEMSSRLDIYCIFKMGFSVSIMYF